MSSRLLASLEHRISAASSERVATCLRAELASHWARRGRLEEATTELSQLRQINCSLGDALTSIWIHVADGVLELTQGRERSAVDRLDRARAVACAVGARREQSVVAAWRAYIAYTRNDLEAMAALCDEVAAAGREADVSAIARAQMLVGQSFHFAGDHEIARDWYSSARVHAAENGDDGLVSALLFNMASHHVCNYRHHVLRGGQASTPFDLLSLTTESVRNYDELVGIGSLESYAGTLLASVHLFHNRFQDALDTFARFVSVAEAQGLARMKSLYVAEMAFCSVKLGNTLEARRLAESADAAISAVVHVDDLAATHCRLSQVYGLLGEEDVSKVQFELAEVQWSKHKAFQRCALEHLAKVRSLREWAH